MPHQPNNTNRRFIGVMLLLLAPIAIGLLFVWTMQFSAGNNHVYSSDFSVVGNSCHVSYWGQPYQKIVRVWDVNSGQQKGEWSAPWGSITSPLLSDSGRRFAYRDSDDEDVFVVGTFVDGQPPQLRRAKLPGGVVRFSVRFTDVDSQLIYEDTEKQIRIYDFLSGESRLITWDRPANEDYYFWLSSTNLIWHSKSVPKNVIHSYCLVDHKLVLQGPEVVETLAKGAWFFADGTKLFLVGADTTKSEITDVKTGETIHLQADDGSGTGWWRPCGDIVVRFDGDPNYDPSGIGSVTGAQVFDGHTGKPILQTKFSTYTTEINYVPTAERFLSVSPSNVIETFDHQGRKTIISPDMFHWWWPARIVGIAAAIIWWLTWSLRQRRGQRSFQPLIDIAILHVFVIVCSGVRFWAYAQGPSWHGALHVWESVIFLGLDQAKLGFEF